MSERRRQGQESGRFRSEEVEELCAEFGMLPHEAKAFLHMHVALAARLDYDRTQAQDVCDELNVILDGLEEKHGKSDYWDRARYTIASKLIFIGEYDLVADLVVRINNLESALEGVENKVVKGVKAGKLDESVIFLLTNAVAAAFRDVSREDELADVGFTLEYFLQLLEPSNADLLGVQATERDEAPFVATPLPEVSYEEAREQYWHAPWEELGPLADSPEKWPEGIELPDRFKLVAAFGVRLHETVGVADEIDRKAAEALKAFIAEKQSGREGEAWDVMRFVAAVKLYDRGGAKFGRIFARSMDDEKMSAMVVHALLERKRDEDAMAVLDDLRDKELHGKMLVLGEWQDPDKIAALIEDLTFVTPRTRQKHDPLLRLGVARGIHEHYAARAEEDPEQWAEKAEIMRKRAVLLDRQITIGYISRKK